MDALKYANPVFRKLYTQGYEFMVGRLPWLWAAFFALSDKIWFQPVFRALRRIYNGLNTMSLVRFIKEGRYDVIVTTHFLSVEVCGWMRRTGQIESRLFTMVTDYDVHRIWNVEGVDVFLVASDFTKGRLLEMGVAPRRVIVTGIPVDEKFLVVRDKHAMRRELGLAEDKFTILVSTSSFGFGPIGELALALRDLQLLIICGHNQALYDKMIARGNPHHRIYKFVDNMEELMAACDVMITKPGGLSITEALAHHLPMIFFSAIPGQEAGNVRVLAKKGIGMLGGDLDEIVREIKALAASPERLQAAREATRSLARPSSVEDIIRQLS